jgi:hypothetical protein
MVHRLRRDSVVSWFLAAWPVLAGVTMALFSDRFTSRSWRFASGMPGGYGWWAGVLIVCGLLMLASLLGGGVRGPHRIGLYITGLILVGVWWIGLGVLFLRAAIADPLANPLGVAVWTPLGVLYWVWAHYEAKRL